MGFNGSGVFLRVRNWVADATAGIKIRADFHDLEDDGFAAGLTNCITKDGQSTITQNIGWNSKRITGLADPVNPQDAVTKAYTDTKITTLPPPVNGGDATNKTYVDAGDTNAVNLANAAQATANAAAADANNRVLRSGDNMTGQLTVNAPIYSLSGSLVARATGSGTASLRIERVDGFNVFSADWTAGQNTVSLWNHFGPVSITYGADGTVWLSNGWKSKAGIGGAYGNDTINCIWVGGQLQFYSNASTIGVVASDYRIKKNVLPLPGMWDTVKALKPIKYMHREFSPPSHVKHLAEKSKRFPENLPGPLYTADDDEKWGFIAHELQETLVPSVASGTKDGEDVQALNSTGIIAALTKALQEAMARIEALEAK